MPKTNVSILIPSKGTYCDYSINVADVGNDKSSGQWQVIDYMPTPLRQGYVKFNSFVDMNGDVFIDKGMYPGYHLFFLKLDYLKTPMLSLFNGAVAHIVMDVKQHIFSPEKEQWAKKAELVPSMTEIIAIFWK